MTDRYDEQDHDEQALETGDQEVVQERRNFLRSLGKWSQAVIGGVLVGGVLSVPKPAQAWVNHSGGWGDRGGWYNRGGGWGNHGGWYNRGGGWGNRGGGWANRGGSAWANRGGGWINNGGWANRGRIWYNG